MGSCRTCGSASGDKSVIFCERQGGRAMYPDEYCEYFNEKKNADPPVTAAEDKKVSENDIIFLTSKSSARSLKSKTGDIPPQKSEVE